MVSGCDWGEMGGSGLGGEVIPPGKGIDAMTHPGGILGRAGEMPG